MNGFWAIFIKEFSHIRREPVTLFFSILVPALQLTIFGYAANTTINNIPMVIFDLDGRQESRRLADALQNTQTFRIVEHVTNAEDFRRAITAGRAKVGVLIPANYSERLLHRQQARIQVLIDGSDAQVAQSALNTVGLLTTSMGMERAKVLTEMAQLNLASDENGAFALPIEARSRLLYNPNLQDSYFFVPGLVALILQVVLAFLTSFSIVKERETGTLEQLFVTPVSPMALLLGKLTPYVILAIAELLFILVLMVALFGVPINGSVILLLALSSLFIVTVLGLGLMISTLAKTQLQSMQFSFLVMLPSVLLSGFMFPRSEMPWPLYLIGGILPVTYFLEILRGLVLRSADLLDLMPQVLGLTACCVGILTLSLTRFHKQLD